MSTFRKKPVVIHAEQLIVGGGSRAAYCPAGVNFGYPHAEDDEAPHPLDGKYWVQTLEGPLLASDRDWIITGVKGEIYPCKPDIFAATYDPVPDGEA